MRRPFFAHVAIENLKLFRIDLLFCARNRCLKQIGLPFCFPDRVKIDNVRVRHALDRCGETIIRNVRTFRSARLAFPKLIDDPPARDLQEPSFKRTNRRIVFQFVDLLRHRDDGFLHDFLRFRIGQTGFARGRINQLPVRIEEFLPALLVVPIRQPIDQTSTRRG